MFDSDRIDSEVDDAQFDEPVRVTIMRDLREVAHKFRHVVAPQKEVVIVFINLILRCLEFAASRIKQFN